VPRRDLDLVHRLDEIGDLHETALVCRDAVRDHQIGERLHIVLGDGLGDFVFVRNQRLFNRRLRSRLSQGHRGAADSQHGSRQKS